MLAEDIFDIKSIGNTRRAHAGLPSAQFGRLLNESPIFRCRIGTELLTTDLYRLIVVSFPWSSDHRPDHPKSTPRQMMPECENRDDTRSTVWLVYQA